MFAFQVILFALLLIVDAVLFVAFLFFDLPLDNKTAGFVLSLPLSVILGLCIPFGVNAFKKDKVGSALSTLLFPLVLLAIFYVIF